MSKKKSTIIDDDPLAWLKDESTVDEKDMEKEMETETETLNVAAEEKFIEDVTKDNRQINHSKVESEICKKEEMLDEGGLEQSLIKEKTVDADSNKDVLLAAAKIDADIEQPGSSNEEFNAVNAENNEENVEMATSNNEKIVLEEDVGIVQVAVLKEAWLSVLDSGKDISIDASAVEDIDTAGLQLLLSLVKTVKKSGRSVSWDAPSEAVINAVKETSLRDALGLEL